MNTPESADARAGARGASTTTDDTRPWAWLVRDARLGAGAGAVKVTLYALAARADDSGACWPTRRTLASDTGLGNSAVSGAIARAEALGVLRVDRRRGRERNTYRLDRSALANLASVPAPGTVNVPAPGTQAPGSMFRQSTENVPAIDSVCSGRQPPSIHEVAKKGKGARIGFDGEGWTGITDIDRRVWAKVCPGVGLDRELAKAAAWVRANGARRKNWARFIARWFGLCNLGRAQEDGLPPKLTRAEIDARLEAAGLLIGGVA